MITFITVFRKFKPPFDIIQFSAMYSWKMNGIKVIAPLNEIGIKEKCTGWNNITLIEEVKRARELGFNNQSPIIKDLIDKALPYINTIMIAYINSDIIISEDFSQIIKKMISKYGYDFYAVGSRLNIELKECISTREKYKEVFLQDKEHYDASTSSDIFIASKFNWRKIITGMPDYILGRWGWDNYLHMRGEILKLKKYNCSDILPILHCKHDFRHIFLQEKAWERKAPSTQHNMALWEKTRSVYGTTRINAWPKMEI